MHVLEATPGPVHYSLRRSDPPGSSRPLFLLYEGACLAVRAPTDQAAVDALALAVAEHELPDTSTRIRGVVLVDRSGAAWVLPERLRRSVARSARQLLGSGLRPLRAHVVEPLPDGHLRLLDIDVPSSPRPGATTAPATSRVRTRRLPVAGWILTGGDEPLEPLASRADAVWPLLAAVDGGDEHRQRAFPTVVAMARSLDLRAAGPGPPDELLRALRRHTAAAVSPAH